MRTKADIKKINLVGTNVLELAHQFKDNVTTLNNSIDEINDAWQDNEANRYMTLLKDNYVANLNVIGEILEEYGNYIKNVSKCYELLEKGTTDKYNGGRY
jgi:hypothetical protein